MRELCSMAAVKETAKVSTTIYWTHPVRAPAIVFTFARASKGIETRHSLACKATFLQMLLLGKLRNLNLQVRNVRTIFIFHTTNKSYWLRRNNFPVPKLQVTRTEFLICRTQDLSPHLFEAESYRQLRLPLKLKNTRRFATESRISRISLLSYYDWSVKNFFLYGKKSRSLIRNLQGLAPGPTMNYKRQVPFLSLFDMQGSKCHDICSSTIWYNLTGLNLWPYTLVLVDTGESADSVSLTARKIRCHYHHRWKLRSWPGHTST